MIKKAIIPAAGLGTRFMPATRAIPKEMFPLGNMPILQHVVVEAIESGIEEIAIIVSKEKQSIVDHFKGYDNIHFIYQDEPKGLGHAILCAKDFIWDEPFAVLLPDEIFIGKDGPVLEKLIDQYNYNKALVIGAKVVLEKDRSLYGIMETRFKPDEYPYSPLEVVKLLEKPSYQETYSQLAIVGRYILTKEVMDKLENQSPGRNNEIQLTDALQDLVSSTRMVAYEIDAKRFDTGNKLGYIQAQIAYGLHDGFVGQELKEYIKESLRTSRET